LNVAGNEDLVVLGNPQSPEMDRFNAALRQVLQVPKKELSRLLAEEKTAKAGKPKPGTRPKGK
jgi:hypothetical protein